MTDTNIIPASDAPVLSPPRLTNLNKTKMTRPPIAMELRFPCHGQPEFPHQGWLGEAREMRGTVLHAGAAGRRS